MVPHQVHPDRQVHLAHKGLLGHQDVMDNQVNFKISFFKNQFQANPAQADLLETQVRKVLMVYQDHMVHQALVDHLASLVLVIIVHHRELALDIIDAVKFVMQFFVNKFFHEVEILYKFS